MKESKPAVQRPFRHGLKSARARVSAVVFVLGTFWSESGFSRSSFYIDVGASPTLLKYKENIVPSLDIKDQSITGKLALALRPDDSALEFGLSVFRTLSVLSHTPASVQKATFTGTNLRVGWTLPFSSKKLDLKLMGGWYFWTMSVPGKVYGIEALSGPQAFIQITFPARSAKGHPFWMYAKYAPVLISGGSIADNREIAFGLGYQLTRNASRIRVSLIADIATMKAEFPSANRAVSVNTYSTGLMFGL